METDQVDSSSPPPPPTDPVPETQQPTTTQKETPDQEKPAKLPASGISSWAQKFKNLQPSAKGDPQSGNAVMSTFSRFTSGLGSRLSTNKSNVQDESADKPTMSSQPGVVVSLTKGFVDSSLGAVKAVQVKARHVVSQNKRRYQEDGFDLDLTYITDNIIAMGFPAGDMSSGLFGYVEGLYRNDIEDVIKFFETRHQAKYKVYNLCSERLYSALLFQGKVASFPFDDHNCPPIHLILSFCQSASSWLKEDVSNVITVHCKAGLGRTGLMISSLLLYLKLFPTAKESIDCFNQKRCIDGKGLVLPSQIRYVKYFERILKDFNGEIQPGRRCMLKGFRLHNCPYWIRPSITISDHNGILFSTRSHPKTKDLLPEDFWFSSKKKGIMIFALPGEPGLTEVAGDFKIHFHDRQGDYYCWLNSTMMENRLTLTGSQLDDFDKRKIPAPGFQVEIVMVDSNGSHAKMPTDASKESDEKPVSGMDTRDSSTASDKNAGSHDKDDVFSDSESEGPPSAEDKHSGNAKPSGDMEGSEAKASKEATTSIRCSVEQVSSSIEGEAKDVSCEDKMKSTTVEPEPSILSSTSVSEFKPVAADASMFSFGDEDEFESD